MSLLDMKQQQSSSVDVATDQEFDDLVAQVRPLAVSTEVAPIARQGVGSRVARFFTALRRTNTFSMGGAAFADPRIYEEYRASLARREYAHETVLKK